MEFSLGGLKHQTLGEKIWKVHEQQQHLDEREGSPDVPPAVEHV